MKKLLITGTILASLLSGCGTTETENSTENSKSSEVNKLQTLEEVGDISVTKFYQKDTGKLIYSMDGTKTSSSVMIDSDGTEKISKNFLQKIEVVENDELMITTGIYKDKDNGNIIVLTDGISSGSLDVQKPNEDIQ